MEVILAATGAFLVVMISVTIAVYILWGIAEMKALRLIGYANPWMAWIPLLNLFALAHCTADKEGNTSVLGLKIPTIVFSFWFVVDILIAKIPTVGSLLSLVFQVICLGTCFTVIYATCENKTEKDTQALGYVSGLIPIIALVKFFTYKSNK